MPFHRLRWLPFGKSNGRTTVFAQIRLFSKTIQKSCITRSALGAFFGVFQHRLQQWSCHKPKPTLNSFEPMIFLYFFLLLPGTFPVPSIACFPGASIPGSSSLNSNLFKLMDRARFSRPFSFILYFLFSFGGAFLFQKKRSFELAASTLQG